MGDLFDVKEKRHASWKDRIIIGIFVLIASALFAGQTVAFELDLLGKPLTVKGYINQSVQFGVAGDHYDTKSGFQQGLMQALVELEYYPVDNVKIFTTGMFSQDWAYPILSDNDDWKFRGFDNARSEQALREDYEDVLKECHVTWTPASFNIRVGKQIVSWGRMDAVRIMDQINPKDQRLGPSDVEFESSIIPIWLAKTEYYPSYVPSFLDELGLEFTFNPNADFIPDKLPGPGNYAKGIWAVDIINSGLRVGKLLTDYEEPDKWDSEGFEYAFRIKGTLPDSTYFTLNYFNGVEDTPVYHSTGAINILPERDDKGRLIIEPYMTGYYPDKEFVGFTFARDFESLYINALGGVAPLVRVEAIYEIDSTFCHNISGTSAGPYKFEEHGAFYGGFAFDWKFKWNLLNPRRYFTFGPQFSMRHIQDYPSNGYLTTAGGSTVSENWYTFFCRLSTQYMHDKLTPSIIYQRDIWQDMEHKLDGSAKADMWLFNLAYEPNHKWSFKTRLSLFENDGGRLYRGTDHYDNLSFTVQYQF